MKHNTLRLLALVFSSLLAFTACSSTGSDYATGESMAPAPAADAGAAEAGDLAGWEHPAAAPEAIEKGEAYLVIDENQEVSTREESMLTFSLKVDTAAYTNVARYLKAAACPPLMQCVPRNW